MRAFRTPLVPGLLLSVLVSLATPAALAKPPFVPTTQWTALPAALDQLIRATRAPGSWWGVLIVHADSGAVWFSTNSTRLFVPASNTKLFSVALALDRFGPDHRFTTTLALADPPDSQGTVAGPLWILGGGVPFNISSNSPTPFAPLIQLLEQRGVHRLTGGIVLEDGWFESPPFGPGWNWDDLQEGYGAPVSAFVFNDNSTRVVVSGAPHPGQPATVTLEPNPTLFAVENRITSVATNEGAHLTFRRLPGESRLRISGTVPAGGRTLERLAVPDAPRAFGLGLQAALSQRGISIAGGIRTVNAGGNAPAPILGSVPSAPLRELVAECLKLSNNLLAHLLLLQVGSDVRHKPRSNDPRLELDDAGRGVAALSTFLGSFGVTGDEVFFEEGSGLSRKNLVSPQATVRLLRHVKKQSWGADFIAALPVGGVDGTLAGRFQEGPARANVRAKTGSLRHVHALAGYVTTAAGQPLVFAIYVNGHQTAVNDTPARIEIDGIVEALAGFPGRGPE